MSPTWGLLLLASTIVTVTVALQAPEDDTRTASGKYKASQDDLADLNLENVILDDRSTDEGNM